MQQVKLYCDAFKAEADMKKWISQGWRVHTCTMSTYKKEGDDKDKVLVVYEKSVSMDLKTKV